MTADMLYDKMKNYFPQAGAITVDCGKTTQADGSAIRTYSVHAFSAHVEIDSSTVIAYGYGNTPEEALVAAAKYFGRAEAEKAFAKEESVDCPVFEDADV